MIFLGVAHNKLAAILQALANRPEVRWVSTTTGRHDIVSLLYPWLIVAPLMSFPISCKLWWLRIEGIRDSATSICLRRQRFHYAGVLYLALLVALCKGKNRPPADNIKQKAYTKTQNIKTREGVNDY